MKIDKYLLGVWTSYTPLLILVVINLVKEARLGCMVKYPSTTPQRAIRMYTCLLTHSWKIWTHTFMEKNDVIWTKNVHFKHDQSFC